MIRFKDVTKRYQTRHGMHEVLKGANATIRLGEKIGILGRNGAGKSTLIRIFAGVERVTSGLVERSMSISWPLAFGGQFQGSLTGLDNLRFICRVYGVPHDDKIDFVQEFAELGKFLYEPVKTYSSGMRARLAFAISLAVDFDCFLIDEIITVGDARFHAKCQTELFEKRADRTFIIVSHEVHKIREHCERALVLKDGKLWDFPDREDAIRFYQDLQ